MIEDPLPVWRERRIVFGFTKRQLPPITPVFIHTPQMRLSLCSTGSKHYMGRVGGTGRQGTSLSRKSKLSPIPALWIHNPEAGATCLIVCVYNLAMGGPGY